MSLALPGKNKDQIRGPSPAASQEQQFRRDVPRRGHVLTTVAEKYGGPIREVVYILSGALEKRGCDELLESLFPWPRLQPKPDLVRTEAEMAAWVIAAIWVVSVATRAVPATGTLKDAEEWFWGRERDMQLTDLASLRAISHAERILQTNVDVAAYYELLPYIFDPHGPGSRLSVRRNPATRAARMRKRAIGVFYTPADVAEYMVRDCLDSIRRNENAPTVFDPACGTGVFLRAALKELRRRHCEMSAISLASECLFGVDIDPWPLDASAFVLLSDVLVDEAESQESPVEVWRRLRLNFRCINTLQIDPVNADLVSDETKEENGLRVTLSRLFPQLKSEPTVVVGNPPYAALGEHADLEQLGRVFKTLAIKSYTNAEIYLAFIEQMTRLANREKCAGALVLPISLACNIGSQFMITRKLIQDTPGHWRFTFFDREPHALFGEDVKTRNAILSWSRDRSNTEAVLASGPLMKWRGDSRAAMFSNIRHTEFKGDICASIPKIDGACQAAAFQMLSARWGCLEQAVQGFERLNLCEALNAGDRMVFVGPTAYNFLNVFLQPPAILLKERSKLSEHPLHVIRCASSKDALIVFSILTSHLAYWWWHVHGDGFHVSRRFLSKFPFGLEVFETREADRLHESGAALWSAIRWNPIVSLNRGRTSLAYAPNGHDEMRRCADEVLVDVANIKHNFVNELQHFTVHTVTARLRDYGGDTINTEERGEYQ